MANLALQMAEAVKSMGVKAVYGEPQEIDGTTVVPVAVVGYGFGGGSDDAENGGGGGGGYSIPVGAYIGDSLGVRFQPNIIAVLAVGIPLIWTFGNAFSKLIKALKK